MAEYQRSNARVYNDVILKRSFYNNGTLEDPYEIDRIEIWKGTYDPEVPELLKDTIYGSAITILDVANDAYDTLGLCDATETCKVVGVLGYEESFSNQLDFIIEHNLTDRYTNVVVYNADANPQIIRPDEIISIDENRIRIVFAIAQSGTVKVYGTEELCDKTQYTVSEYEQTVVGETVVTVTHNLNDDDPRVTIYDENYRYVYPDNIVSQDNNTLIVTFAMPFSGVIVVLGGTSGYRTTGFGFQPTAISNKTGDFYVMEDVNDRLSLEVDGVTENLILPPNPHYSVDDIVGLINNLWTAGQADNFEGKIRLRANDYGRNHYLEIKSIIYNGADDLGFELGQYDGMGYQTAEVVGSIDGPYDIIADTNDMLRFKVNQELDEVLIQLAPGLASATNIVNDINGQLAANYPTYPAISYLHDTGRVAIKATQMTGITRDGVGQYTAIYSVPGEFITEGVLNNIYKDVWYYAPNVSYMMTVMQNSTCCTSVYVPDDTCCFIVYPEDYFSDCGYADYKYTFKLQDKQINKGEIKDFVVDVQTVPEYPSPDRSLWLLPITNAEYMTASYGGNVVQDWTPVDVNRGVDLKIRLDGTTMQDGAYKMKVKLALPNGAITISDWMRFNVLGPCTI